MTMAEDNRKVVIELQNVKRYFQVGEETVKARHHSGHFGLGQVDAAEPAGLSRYPHQW